jgi:hypothetical protein
LAIKQEIICAHTSDVVLPGQFSMMNDQGHDGVIKKCPKIAGKWSNSTCRSAFTTLEIGKSHCSGACCAALQRFGKRQKKAAHSGENQHFKEIWYKHSNLHEATEQKGGEIIQERMLYKTW